MGVCRAQREVKFQSKTDLIRSGAALECHFWGIWWLRSGWPPKAELVGALGTSLFLTAALEPWPYRSVALAQEEALALEVLALEPFGPGALPLELWPGRSSAPP